MTLQSGTRPGSYEITSLLGSGGMGEVYRAKDLKLGRDVAIKVLREELATDPERLRRFEQEARSASALNHPNIITIYDIGKHQATPYIAMEYVEGKTLREMLAGGPLPTKKLLQLATQIAEGLAKAHSAGIVHRDLKPENLMVTDDGYVKILDFGLAKLLAPPAPPDSESPTATKEGTVAGAVMGTASYMSPEQALGKPLDARTDVFSLGAVLYEMATGKKPFQGETAVALFDEILHKEPASPSSLNLELPGNIEIIINRALNKDPQQRYPSAKELLVDLGDISTGPPITESSSQKSIVVLPFENISPDPEQEYFCDGMTEEIISDLSKIQSLRVISRTSSMRLKGTDKNIGTIGKELNVQHVLEGSVRKAGNNLRITAQLIDSTNDAHLWAEKYSGTLEDVFEIQEKVSRSIVDAIELKLTAAERHEIAKRSIDNVHAYESYLRARQKIWVFTKEAFDGALRHLNEALENVGDNPLIYAAMGQAYYLYSHLEEENPEAYIDKVEWCARKVLELEPESPKGICLMGLVHTKREGEYLEAVRHLKRSVDKDPNDPFSLWWLSFCAMASYGQSSLAKPCMDKLLEVDPLSPATHWAQALYQWFSGRFDLALASCRKAYESEPDSPIFQFMLGYCLSLNGRTEEAFPNWEQVMKKAPGVWASLSRFFKHAIQGQKMQTLQSVTEELETLGRWDEGVPVWLAEGYSLIDEGDRALDWLAIAIRRGCKNYPFLSEYDPFLANIRGEERFKKLMERVKYEWEHFEV